MEQINSNNEELNGLSKNKLNNNLLKKELPINTNENNIDEINDKLFEEEKNKINFPIPYFEHNLRNIAHNFIPINSLSDKVSEENINTNLKQKRNISDETLENGLNLDEQNLKEYYDNIENEINKLKNDKSKNLEENKNKNISLNNSNNKSSLKMNSQFENDLFYYSDEEDKDINKKVEEEKEKENINKDTKSNISQDKINNINNNQDKEDKDKNDINIKTDEKNKDKKINLKESLSEKSDFDKKLLEKVEYGIDESGNPFSIKDNKEEDNEIINNKKEIKKAVAYIIQQKEKGKNYLIDTKGKLIPKMDDGYYNYKKDNIRLLIKDFDVQHPELRVFGARRNDDFLFQDEEKDESEHDIKNDDYNHKSIEIKKSEEKNKQKEKIVINRNANLNLFKKNNISVENFEKYKVKKLVINKNLLNMKNSSPIAIKKKIIQRNNEHINIWKIKENPKTDDRGKYIYDKKGNKIFYKKLNPKSLNNISNTTGNNNASINEYEKFENSDTIKRTNNILNKSVRGLYTYRNYANINNSGIESNSKKMNLNKSDYSKNIINRPLYTEETKNNNNIAQEIRNVTCTTSRISLYKYKRNNKRGGSFSSNYYNKIFNLKSLLNPKKDNINNINNNGNKDNNIYSKENHNPNDYKIKKSKSSKYIISTIDKISNSIKYIKNRIENNLIKLNTDNDIYNNANNNLNEKIKNSIPLSTVSTSSNSQTNISKKILPYNNYYSNNKLQLLNYRNNLNTANDLNQKKNTSLKENKKFQCSILCKEVNDIISNYTTKNNANKHVTKINTIYDYDSEIKTNDNKINSFLNKRKNISNLNFAKHFTQRYNYITESNNNIEENKTKEELYKNKILSFENSFKIKNNNSLKYLNTFNNNLKAENMKNNIKLNTKSNSIGCLKDINNDLNNDKSKDINKNKYNYYYNNTFKSIKNNINDSNLNYCLVMNNYNRNYNYTERNNYTNQNI